MNKSLKFFAIRYILLKFGFIIYFLLKTSIVLSDFMLSIYDRYSLIRRKYEQRN